MVQHTGTHKISGRIPVITLLPNNWNLFFDRLEKEGEKRGNILWKALGSKARK